MSLRIGVCVCVYTHIRIVVKAYSLQLQSAQHKLYSELSLNCVSWIARQILYPMRRLRDDVTNYEKDILWLEKLIDVEGSHFMKVRSSRRTMSHKIKNIIKNTLFWCFSDRASYYKLVLITNLMHNFFIL
jgi:hypothetical protein